MVISEIVALIDERLSDQSARFWISWT